MCFLIPFFLNMTLLASQDSRVSVEGTVLPNPTGFAVNLITDSNNFPLHVYPRWFEGNVFVLNTFTNGGWGQEVRVPFPPGFGIPGSQFTISIKVQPGAFVISVNGYVLHIYPTSASIADLNELSLTPATASPTVCIDDIELS
eukprot:m.3374 g.3374  ORF g.3374 m.3374 type:complete len:143 (+) comp9322_c0_seq1:1697-2125(+)